MKTNIAKERPIIVTTARRGVFFGYTSEDAEAIILRRNLTLTNARNCIYWSAETHGYLGLASIGPQNGSRVGPAVSKLSLESITSVADCSEASARAFEAEPWAS
jgi:hypothetical protein